MTAESMIRALGEIAVACRRQDVAEVQDWPLADQREALAAADRAADSIAMMRARVLAAVDRSGMWALEGDRDVAAWRAKTSRAGLGAARGEMDLAAAVTAVPDLADAVSGGLMTGEHAKSFARELGSASEEQRTALTSDSEARERMFRAAGHTDAGQFRKTLKHEFARLDPQKFEADHEAIRRRRYARVKYTQGGVQLEAFLDPVDGRYLQVALDATLTRPGAGDVRTADQRRADALVAIAKATLNAGEPTPSGQVRPQVMMTVTAAEWTRWRERGEFPGLHWTIRRRFQQRTLPPRYAMRASCAQC